MISAYMDDLFLWAHSRLQVMEQREVTIRCLYSLGFHHNLLKSHLEPCHQLVHPDHLWNTINMTVSARREMRGYQKVCYKDVDRAHYA